MSVMIWYYRTLCILNLILSTSFTSIDAVMADLTSTKTFRRRQNYNDRMYTLHVAQRAKAATDSLIPPPPLPGPSQKQILKALPYSEAEAARRPRVLAIGLASGYDAEAVRVFCNSLWATSAPDPKVQRRERKQRRGNLTAALIPALDSALEVVLVGVPHPVHPDVKASALGATTILGAEDLAGSKYMGLLGDHRWEHLEPYVACTKASYPKDWVLRTTGHPFNCGWDPVSHGERLLEEWQRMPLLQFRHLLFTLVIINRLTYGEVPHIILTADTRDVYFQGDVRSILADDRLWSTYWSKAREGPRVLQNVSTFLSEMPSILHVAREGCLAGNSEVNTQQLVNCYGKDVTDAYYNRSWITYNSGTTVGTTKAMLYHER
eukprot:gene12609-14904_t